MIIGLIGSLLTGGISLAKDYLGNKSKEKQIKMRNSRIRLEAEGVVAKAAAQAKAQAMITRMEGDIAWENIHARNAATTWRDEYMTIFATSPYWLAMLPAFPATVVASWHGEPQKAYDAINASIDCIANFPDALHWMCGAATSAAFGIREMQKFISFKKGV